ncbi:uncharacterized protein LOC116182334 [Photinus pyralis]|uniref:uncharacterized protein LOC116182334 n=1 Tax=Photinus pyralis TaxID=7054 RepID=UPI0012674710|nr:uncharacterized protein LOC116182334 [Photinus pyralis]
MSESSDSNIEFPNTPPEITQCANNVVENLLPQQSRHVYEKYYKLFMDWRESNKAQSFSENVLLAFFHYLAKKWKSSTLWKIYSMMRATLNAKHDVDISKFVKLRAFLKRSSDGYLPKKSTVFTTVNVKKFLETAPDDIYLATKVALVIGITGACRKNELYNIKMTHIKDLDSAILFDIPNTKTKTPRQFTITGEFYNIVKKYAALRPADVPSDNFFVNYQKGKCTKQVIGINKLGNMPKQIATFLNLENPQNYTGHCFRRTSATMLVDAGADITTLKRHGGGKSSEGAEGYVDNSLQNRINVASKIVTSVIGSDSLFVPSSSNVHTTVSSSSTNQAVVENSTANICNTPILNFHNCQNTINITINKN